MRGYIVLWMMADRFSKYLAFSSMGREWWTGNNLSLIFKWIFGSPGLPISGLDQNRLEIHYIWCVKWSGSFCSLGIDPKLSLTGHSLCVRWHDQIPHYNQTFGQFHMKFINSIFTYYFLLWVGTLSNYFEYLCQVVYIPSKIVNMEEIFLNEKIWGFIFCNKLQF